MDILNLEILSHPKNGLTGNTVGIPRRADIYEGGVKVTHNFLAHSITIGQCHVNILSEISTLDVGVIYDDNVDARQDILSNQFLVPCVVNAKQLGIEGVNTTNLKLLIG